MTQRSPNSGRRTPVRDLATGLTSVAVATWLFLFASPATIEVATLVAAISGLIWFATVDPARLREGDTGQPNIMLFGLASIGLALLISGLVVIGSITAYLAAGVGGSAVVVGLVRAWSRIAR